MRKLTLEPIYSCDLLENYQLTQMSRVQRQHETISQKRERFMKSLREQQRREIFEGNRQWSNPPTVALIPYMLQQKDFDNFEEVMDSIEQESLYLVDQKFRSFIDQQIKKTTSQLIQQHLFRLTNRLQVQSSSWLDQAIERYKKQKSTEQSQLLIKQIAYHIERNYRQGYCKNQYLNKIILQGNILKPLSTDMIFYRLQIACRLELPQNRKQAIQGYQDWFDSFLALVDQGLACDQQMVIVRVIQAIIRLKPNGQNGIHITKMKHFSKIISLCLQQKTDTEIVSKCIQILAELLAGQEAAFDQVVKHKQLIDVYERYMGHIYDQIRLKVYWGLSNIAASNKSVANIKRLIPKMHENLLIEPKQRTKMEIRFAILNYLCNLQVQEAIEATMENKWVFQFLRESLEQSKQDFLSRTLFAIYSIVCKVPLSRVKFEEVGTKKVLDKLYNQEHEEERSRMIQNTIEKLISQDSNSISIKQRGI